MTDEDKTWTFQHIVSEAEDIAEADEREIDSIEIVVIDEDGWQPQINSIEEFDGTVNIIVEPYECTLDHTYSEIEGDGRCAFCGEEISSLDPTAWKEVRGWVGGPRKDSMRLRTDTGWYAHSHCVEKQQQGQAADQPSLLEPSQEIEARPVSDEEVDLFRDDNS